MKQITMLLTNGFEPDVRVYKEALYLTRKGVHVTILCWDRWSSLPEYEEKDGIEIIRFKIRSVYGTGMRQLRQFFEYISACRKYLKAHHCDYLHCNDIDGAITGYIARVNNTTMVFDMHEFHEQNIQIMRRVWRKLIIFLIKKSIAALYENDLYLEQNYAAIHNKLFELKNYPDRRLVMYKPKTPSNVFRVCYHGCVRFQIAEFCALFEAVKDMTDVRVDINGGGADYQRLREIEKDYKNVHINGQFDGVNECTKLYEKTDLLYCAYPPDDVNMHDGEPVKYFEAILTGTPILATETILVGKKTKQNGFGLVCDTRNPEAIRDAILKIKNDKELWKKCSENELAVAHKYDWQEEVKVLDKVYGL